MITHRQPKDGTHERNADLSAIEQPDKEPEAGPQDPRARQVEENRNDESVKVPENPAQTEESGEEESEEESEEELEDDRWQQLQSVVNEVCHSKWKQAARNTIGNARAATQAKEQEDDIPPLIKRPQEDVRAYAERTGLWKHSGDFIGRRRGPTSKSEPPIPTAGIL